MSRVKFSPFGQAAQKSYQLPIQATSDNVSVGAGAGTAATVVLSAGTQPWVVSGIVWSYSGPVTAGRLQIGDSSGSLLDWDIHAGSGQNFGQVLFQPPLQSQITNSSVAITLAGSAGVTGKLNVEAWQEI